MLPKKRKSIRSAWVRIVAIAAVYSLLSGSMGVSAYAEETLPSSIEMDPVSKTININDKFQLAAKVKPVHATDKSVTWASDREDIAEVSSNGFVTGVNKGVATITATSKSDPGVKASCTVTVNYIAPKKLALPENATLLTGNSKALSATFTPANTSFTELEWSSSNPALADVGPDGVVTAAPELVVEGSATKDITSEDGIKVKITATAAKAAEEESKASGATVSPKTATCVITVMPKLPSAIRLAPSTMELGLGSEGDFYYNLVPEGTVEYKDTVTANSSAPDIATAKIIRGEGEEPDFVRVTASGDKSGKAVITVTTVNGKTDKCTVNVLSKPPALSIIGESAISLKKKSKPSTLTVRTDPFGASGSIIWESSNVEIATVKSNGKISKDADYKKTPKRGKSTATVTPVGYGSCEITARSSLGGGEESKVTYTINVKENFPTSYKLDNDRFGIRVGQGAKKIKASKIKPEKADILWKSSDTRVATVSPSGSVTPVSPGVAEISLEPALGAKGAVCTVTVKDRYNNDKFGNAIAIANNSAVTDACLFPKDDVDFFSFTLDNAADVTINLTNIAEGCNYDMYLYSSSKETAKTHDTTSEAEHKSITDSLKKGTYYIKVASGGGYSTEPYRLEVLTGAKPQSVSISGAPESELKFGDTARLTAYVSPSSATNKSVIWTSSDPKIASVSGSGLVTVASSAEEAEAWITARASLGTANASCLIKVRNTPVGSVSILPEADSSVVGVGARISLKPFVLPEAASNKTVSWASSDSGIASVSGAGVVTGVSEGTATITVTTESENKEASRTVKVETIYPESIRLSHSSAELAIGAALPVVAYVSPANASDRSVSWESSDDGVVEVIGGTLYARSEGVAVIRAATNADDSIEAFCNVNVVYQPPTGVSVSPAALTLGEHGTQKVNAVVLPYNASDKTIEWSSSNPDIAEVDSFGVVSAKQKGDADIMAASCEDGVLGICKVTVAPETLAEEIILSQQEAEVDVRSTLKLTAEVLPENTTVKELKWSSGDTYIATVSNDGVVTGRSEGRTSITARTISGAVSASCDVDVKAVGIAEMAIHLGNSAVPVENLYLDMKTDDGAKASYQFNARISPADATCQEVSWSCSDTRFAYISESGLLTARNEGETMITAEALSGEMLAVCKVSIVSNNTPPTEVVVSKVPASILVGDSFTLKATVKTSKCTNKQVEWESSNTSVAVVNKETGEVKALAPGKAKITAKAVLLGKDKNKKPATIFGSKNITVKPVKPKSVSSILSQGMIGPGGIEGLEALEAMPVSYMRVGEKQLLKAGWKPADVTDPVVKWSVVKPADGKAKAAIDSTGTLTANVVGKAKVKVAVYSRHDKLAKKTRTITVNIVADPTKVKISPEKTPKKELMRIGDSRALKKEIEPAEAKGRTVEWSSDNPEVATVSKKGVVKAVGSGKAKIKASIESVKDPPTQGVNYDIYEVEVETVKPTKISLKPKTLGLAVKEAKSVNVTFTPKDATRSLKWSSSDEEVATVDEKTGLITGVKPGRATITAYSLEDLMIASECNVSVKEELPTSVKITPSSKSIRDGVSFKLKAKIKPTNCTDKGLIWESSNESIVSVDENGNITANGPGTATIKVTTNAFGKNKKQKTAKCKVTVKPVLASKLSLTPASISLSAGNTQQLSFKTVPELESITDKSPVYKSANTKIAIVSESGLVTGLKFGKTTVSVKVGGKTATCKVNVTTDPPASMTLTPMAMSMTVGDGSRKLTTTVKPKTADQGVLFTSSNTQVATVSDDGQVTAVGSGVCEIVARTYVGAYEMSCIVSVFDRKAIVEKSYGITLAPGESSVLEITAESGAGREWIWRSSAPDVADVGQDGMVTAKKPGKATIVAATLWGDSVTFAIEVK